MEQFIGCDAYKKFSVFVAVDEKGHAVDALRVAHERPLYREFLARLPAHSSIALEASSSYSWLVDEMERVGHRPILANPHEAKRRAIKQTNWMLKGRRSHFAMVLCRRSGFRQLSSAINASCLDCAFSWSGCERE